MIPQLVQKILISDGNFLTQGSLAWRAMLRSPTCRACSRGHESGYRPNRRRRRPTAASPEHLNCRKPSMNWIYYLYPVSTSDCLLHILLLWFLGAIMMLIAIYCQAHSTPDLPRISGGKTTGVRTIGKRHGRIEDHDLNCSCWSSWKKNKSIESGMASWYFTDFIWFYKFYSLRWSIWPRGQLAHAVLWMFCVVTWHARYLAWVSLPLEPAESHQTRPESEKDWLTCDATGPQEAGLRSAANKRHRCCTKECNLNGCPNSEESHVSMAEIPWAKSNY